MADERRVAGNQLRVVSWTREAPCGADDRGRAKRTRCAGRHGIAKHGGDWPPVVGHVEQGSVARRLLPVPFAQVTAREALSTRSAAHDLLRAPTRATRRRGTPAGWPDADIRVSGRPSFERVLREGWYDVYELPRSAQPGLSRREIG